MESSLSFQGHLHNGDPLTSRTRLAPAGRPISGEPPFSWAESAADVLNLKQTDQIDFIDTPEEMLWYCERYNGWGYQTGAGQKTTPNRRSPYLWSKTNHWKQGKYVADGNFSKEAGSEQVGVAAIFKRMEELGHISFGSVQAVRPKDSIAVSKPTPNQPEPILRRGDLDIWVSVVQHLLNGCGYGPVAVTGELGVETEVQLEKFASDLGLSVEKGVVDSAVWKALNDHTKLPGWMPAEALNTGGVTFGTEPRLKRGDKNIWVSILQHTLNGCDFGPLEVDSDFGPTTEKALKKFQTAESLANSGVADSQTWDALNSYPKLSNWMPRSMAVSPRNSNPNSNSSNTSVSETLKTTNGFNRKAFVEFIERELSRNLNWRDSMETRKYTKPFERVLGRERFPWCAATVLWCLNNFDGRGGLNIPIQIPGQKFTLGLVEQWQIWMQDLGFYIDNDGLNRPQAGDIIMFDWDQPSVKTVDKDWEDHIGFFLYMNGSKFVCAEGNAMTSMLGHGGQTGIFERYQIDIQGWAHLPEGCKYDPATQSLS